MKTTKIAKTLLLLIVLLSCAGAAPVKDFKTIQFLPRHGDCFDRLKKDDTIETKCYFDNGTEEEGNWITIRKTDYNKELNYQDLLKKECKKWKR